MTKQQSCDVAETDETFYIQPRPSLIQKTKHYLRMDFQFLQSKRDSVRRYVLLRNNEIWNGGDM